MLDKQRNGTDICNKVTMVIFRNAPLSNEVTAQALDKNTSSENTAINDTFM
jgi:hypothetical protein